MRTVAFEYTATYPLFRPKRRTEKAATGAKLLVGLCCAIKRRNGNLTSGYMYEAVRAQLSIQ